jgi:hypothetical protein
MLTLNLSTTIKPTDTLVHLIKERKSTNDSKNKPI